MLRSSFTAVSYLLPHLTLSGLNLCAMACPIPPQTAHPTPANTEHRHFCEPASLVVPTCLCTAGIVRPIPDPFGLSPALLGARLVCHATHAGASTATYSAVLPRAFAGPRRLTPCGVLLVLNTAILLCDCAALPNPVRLYCIPPANPPLTYAHLLILTLPLLRILTVLHAAVSRIRQLALASLYLVKAPSIGARFPLRIFQGTSQKAGLEFITKFILIIGVN